MYAFAALILILISIVYLFFKSKYKYWEVKGVPNPSPKIFFGNTKDAILIRVPLYKVFDKIYNQYKGYSYVGIYNLTTPALIIRDAELVKDVLIKHFAKFRNNWIDVEQHVDPIVGFSPFVLNDDEWKTVRTKLTPQFTALKIKSMFPLITKGCENMIQFVKNKSKDNKSLNIDVIDLTARYTGDNVVSCAFGFNGKSFTDEVPITFKISQQIANQNSALRLKQMVGFFLPTLRKLFKTTFLGDPVAKVFSDIILEAIRYRKENNITRNDYLDFIKELKTKPTTSKSQNDELIAHAYTFFLDGFETSSLSLAYGLFELALQPDIQTKAQQEIEAVLEKYNNELTYDAMQEMQCIENILSETLRKHPIILFISRICNEDHVFPPPRDSPTAKEVIIEKGTQIFISVNSIHNNPEYYPHPNNFDPDRFTEEVKNSRPKCSYLGFGEGPRSCLGRQFAIVQIKLALIFMLLNFNIRVNNRTALPIEYENVHLFNSPKQNIWLDFYKRK